MQLGTPWLRADGTPPTLEQVALLLNEEVRAMVQRVAHKEK
jgi:hypothetical protein